MKILYVIILCNCLLSSSSIAPTSIVLTNPDFLDYELTSIDEVDQNQNNVIMKKSETPSETCKLIMETFGWAVSNWTLCSVRNARPIHLCQECVQQYLKILQTHHKFLETIDEKGNPCQEYFINLDRLEIVSEAYKYTHHLWRKANCNFCFEKDKNGSLTGVPTPETVRFNKCYRATKNCFKNHSANANETCIDCKDYYDDLTEVYIEIQDGIGGDQICMDIVDTMNITREIWSNRYNCSRKPDISVGLQVGVGMMALIPVLFYGLAYILSNKQEAQVLQQKRLAEVFAVNSSSGSFVGQSFPRLRLPQRHPVPVHSESS